MKNKSIRILSIILFATMVLTIINVQNNFVFGNDIAPFATCVGDHTLRVYSDFILYDCNLGDRGHCDYLFRTYECTKCGIKNDELVAQMNIRSHSLSTEEYHTEANPNTHYVNKTCSVCPYQKVTSYSCSGKPCIIIARIILEE